MKKGKMERLAAVEIEAAARTILEQDKAINSLTGPELRALLKWYGMEKPGDGKVPEKRQNGGRSWRKEVCSLSNKVDD